MNTAATCCPPRLEVSSVVERVGNTPLFDLSRLVGRGEVRLFAKAEMTNPGGSVEDRPALAMIRDGEARGLPGTGFPDKGRRILDATSGNTGIAYAMLGAALGYGVTLCLPGSASAERKRILHAYGAEVVITDPPEGWSPFSAMARTSIFRNHSWANREAVSTRRPDASDP